jgi:hypothetical protein
MQSNLFDLFIFKHNQSCADIWRCFSDDEYDEDQHDIIEQIQQLRQQLDQSRNEVENQRDAHSSANEQFRVLFGKFIDIFVSSFRVATDNVETSIAYTSYRS